jgi:hypothetical protein
MHFPERLASLDAQFLQHLVEGLNDNTMSTIMSGYTTMALGAYNHSMSSAAASAPLSISAVNANNQESTLMMSNVMYQQVNIGGNATKINFKNPDKQAYFYQLSQAGFEKQLPAAAMNNGIEVYREYLHADNSAASDAALGEELIVHVRARATDNQYHFNVALVDLLPGGFEVVTSSVQPSNMDYDDVREDRVIYFGTISPDSVDLTYRIKATNMGQYTVPPMVGKAMYNPAIQSIGVAGKISVR